MAQTHLNNLRSASDTTIVGVGTEGVINGGGLKIDDKSNIIVQNIIINKVVGNDGITIQESNNIWIDHNEFYSDTSHGVDYYDGQLDITHGSDWITVSWNYFHDHYKVNMTFNCATKLMFRIEFLSRIQRWK